MLKRLFIFFTFSFSLVSFFADAYAFDINGNVQTLETNSIVIDGIELIPLVYVCKAHDVSYSWDNVSSIVKLYRQGKLLRLLINEKEVDSDGKFIELKGVPSFVNGTLMVPVDILNFKWWDLVKTPEKKVEKKPVLKRRKKGKSRVVELKQNVPPAKFIDKVIIDPGHGGKDYGTYNHHLVKEKSLVLEYSKLLKAELEKNGISVVLTRNRDHFVSLPDRAKMANENDADLFISIHANAHHNKKSNGFEVFYLSSVISNDFRVKEIVSKGLMGHYALSYISKNKKNLRKCYSYLTNQRKQGFKLAKDIDSEIKNSKIIRSRGVKSGKYFVLKWIEKPAVLIELGFLSNPKDKRMLLSASGKQKIVKTIVDGILKYKRDYEKK